MDINRILQKVDAYFSENKGAEAEKLMRESIITAMEEQDDNSLLQLLNELLGYYRETSQVENSYAVAKQAIALAQQMGLADSIPYATTLLNVANAYRAGGKLEESLEYYLQVREVYDRLLSGDNMLVASLENNLSLLYQEMGDFEKAKISLLAALAIVEKKGAEFEIAVTYANLASTCMQLGQSEEAGTYARRAITDFEKMGVADAHYGAALSALGTYYYKKKEYHAALEIFRKAMHIMEVNLGRNEYYYRLQENVSACENAVLHMSQKHDVKQANAVNPMKDMVRGLALCREYYEIYGKPMLEQQFPEYVDKIAVGLVGEGSDCFGYDDKYSRDHDWGPDFCMWVTEETYNVIGEALQQAYEQLPTEWKGFKRTVTSAGKGRRGVMTISSFYKRLLQTDSYEQIDWRSVSDASLAAAVNGEVFKDAEGIFTAFREKLLKGYPEEILYLKLAESAARFAQTAQYNYDRMKKRGDEIKGKPSSLFPSGRSGACAQSAYASDCGRFHQWHSCCRV